MRWQEAKAALQTTYDQSPCARESGSFSSLIGYFLSALGRHSPLFSEDVLSDEQTALLFGWMEQVKNGLPPQYAVGKAWFDRGEFFVGEGVLIPRPDTEILVEQAVRRLPQNAKFYDLCCGSGCVGIAVLIHREDVRCIACDVLDSPLYYTEKNALHNGVQDRHETMRLDVLSSVLPPLQKGEMVVANPPYLTKEEMQKLPILLEKEPREALDGGEDGLIFYRAILKHYQKISTRFLFEIGCAQAADVSKIAREMGFEHIEVVKDYGGRDRVVYCEKKSN